MSGNGRGEAASRRASQRHAIRRQIVELHVRNSAEAHRLFDVIGAVVQDKIAPILERCFSALSDPARVDRIDRLELDLGTLHSARLTDEIVAKVEAVLPVALRRARPVDVGTGAAEGGAHGSALLLISQFARTGGLPWWSDARKLNALDGAVDTAHRTSPAGLAALLRALAADRLAMERLVRHQSDARLERLLWLLAPSAVAVTRQLGPLLAEAPALAGLGKVELRHLVWRETLIAAAGGVGDEEALLESVLTHLALAAETTLSLLLDDLRDASPTHALGHTIEGLARGVPQGRRAGVIAKSRQQGSDEATRLASRVLSEAAEDETAHYVDNAGLCLLWPFLVRFFARLGLLTAENTAFLSEAARCRAVGLLHYLATGEREPPEFWLPLNKGLCGLDLDALEVFGPPVTDDEADESERLLEAAIAHAACLGTISPDGFRGTFLLRRGALSTRDGAWLLRVERQAADVLLDRFPWKTEWIRLPWMQAPLRVEW